MDGTKMTQRTAVAVAALWLGVATALAPLGCAINPATGERQLSLIGEGQEIELGRQSDREVVESIGLYGGPELQGYVQGLGEKLAATSERPELPWTFRVVDDASVNAFALPGGFIYVTRGMMTHLDSEAELVAVLGHEIGHVTARHSVNQMSKAQLYSLGLGIGMAVSEELREFGGLAQTGLALLMLKHSRDDERQSDELGLRYMVDAGYDPHEMADVFGMLDRLGGRDDDGRVPGWLSTHPAPGNREQTVAQRAAALPIDPSSLAVRREAYLATIDGMVFGPDPREGFFRDSLFLHPELAFSLRFPAGFKTVNQKRAVVGASPQQNAVIELSLAGEGAPAAELAEFVRQAGIEPASSLSSGSINGLPAAGRYFTARLQNGATLRGLAAFVEHGGKTFRLLGYANDAGWSQWDDEIERTVASFDRVTDRGVLDVEPARVEIVDLERSLPLERFAASYDASVDLGTLALINQVSPEATLQAGRAYKVVRGRVG